MQKRNRVFVKTGQFRMFSQPESSLNSPFNLNIYFDSWGSSKIKGVNLDKLGKLLLCTNQRSEVYQLLYCWQVWKDWRQGLIIRFKKKKVGGERKKEKGKEEGKEKKRKKERERGKNETK